MTFHSQVPFCIHSFLGHLVLCLPQVNAFPQFTAQLLIAVKLPLLWDAQQHQPTRRDSVFRGRISETTFSCVSSYNVSEKAGSVSVTVQRTGNLNQYAIVLCRTEQGTASSSSRLGSQPGEQDYVEYAGQVGGRGAGGDAPWVLNCLKDLWGGYRLPWHLPTAFYPTSLSTGFFSQVIVLCSFPTILCS